MISAEIPGQIPTEGLAHHEKLLPGTVAVVTGGSRDIGAAIVKTLALQGVEVVSSFNNKQKRADRVKAEVEETGGVANFLQADIATPAGRAQFVRETLGISQEIDFLVLNTSGDTVAVNMEASDDLVTQFLPHMKEGGTIVRLQSVPGHFDPQLRGLGKMISLYDDVARYKYADSQNLRNRIPELSEKGIRFLEVTPPVVEDTSNMKLFNMVAKRETGGVRTATEMHDEISDKLGLPRTVTAERVAEEILDLFIRWDVPTGHTEFFNGVEDVQTALETWYGSDQVYVQTLQRMTPHEKEKTGYVAIGRSIVSQEQVQRNTEELIAPFVYSGSKHFQEVNEDHAKGHFRKESGFPLILPGHKQIRAAVETLKSVERTAGNTHEARLGGFNWVNFKKVVQADNDDVLVIDQKVSMRAEFSAFYNVTVDIFDATAATLNELEIRFMEDPFPNTLLEDQLIEGAAQAAGAALLPKIDGENMPLFLEIGKTEFTGVMLKAGAGVEYRVQGKGNRRMIIGDVGIYSDGVLVGTVSGLKAMVVPKDKVKELISS